MKKLLALLLALLLTVTCLVACGEKADDSTDTGTGTTSVEKDEANGTDNSAPATLTAETIIGTWEGTMTERGDLSYNVTFTFDKNGKVTFSFDEKELKALMVEKFKDEDYLEEVAGVTPEEFNEALENQGMTVEEYVDAFLGMMSDSTGDYSFDGETLTLDGQKTTVTYKNGTLTMIAVMPETGEVATTTVLTKK